MKKNLTKISPKLKKPKLKAPTKLRRHKRPEEKISQALSDVPRITSDTLEEHREEVLSSARKYIYPLQHSKHNVVRNSILILLLVMIVFFAGCAAALYKFQSTNVFIYGVTKVVPFPVAKIGSHWVSYKSYLFELRRNMHYYHTQQHADFTTRGGKQQLKRLKSQALDSAVQAAYVNELADQHGVTVSDRAVNDEVALLRQQNRLGSSDRVLQDVLNEFWGWSENDFKHELHQQLLQQAVVAKLDTTTNKRASSALNRLEQGADFGKLAAKVSDDTDTKSHGGQYASPITANDRSLPPALTAQITKLKPGQISGIINTGYGLEIVKIIDKSHDSTHVAHIQFRFKPITDYTKQLKQQQPVHKFIKI
jgi:parvulin-like peptidyl-prolyl isomerase